MDFYTFSELLQQNESFLGSMQQGFKQSYDGARQARQEAKPQQNQQDFEKFSSVALPALKKAHSFAQQMSQKTGIPLPLATAVIASGIVGGPAAVPMAALLYFVRKPMMSVASGGFDKVFGNPQQQQAQTQQQPQQPAPQQQMQPQPQQQSPWAFNPINVGTGFENVQSPLNLMSFQEYCLYKEGWASNAADWTGKKIGSMAGSAAGRSMNLSGRIAQVVKSSGSSIVQFAKENKLAVAKTLWLFGVGAVIGYGVGSLTDSVMGQVAQGVGESGLVSPEEMADLQSVGPDEITDYQWTSDSAGKYFDSGSNQTVDGNAQGGIEDIDMDSNDSSFIKMLKQKRARNWARAEELRNHPDTQHTFGRTPSGGYSHSYKGTLGQADEFGNIKPLNYQANPEDLGMGPEAQNIANQHINQLQQGHAELKRLATQHLGMSPKMAARVPVNQLQRLLQQKGVDFTPLQQATTFPTQ